MATKAGCFSSNTQSHDAWKYRVDAALVRSLIHYDGCYHWLEKPQILKYAMLHPCTRRTRHDGPEHRIGIDFGSLLAAALHSSTTHTLIRKNQ